MLTTENIAMLRRGAYRSQSRRADRPWAVVRFEGGPRAGQHLRRTNLELIRKSPLDLTVSPDFWPHQLLVSWAPDDSRVDVSRSPIFTPEVIRNV